MAINVIVDKYKYLGIILTQDGILHKEIHTKTRQTLCR